MERVNLGLTGPAQSDDLFHFTGRNGSRTSEVPQEIRDMNASQRLAAILREERLRAFPPFGVETPCVCFSECSPAQLAYLIGLGLFEPWAIVTSRTAVLSCGGGAVAYVPDAIHQEFQSARLEHWAVRTGHASTWLHEREWRLPKAPGAEPWVKLSGVQAILVGAADWRPDRVDTHWVDGSTGEPLPGPSSPQAVPYDTELPRLWRESAIWVWDAAAREVKKYPPGELC